MATTPLLKSKAEKTKKAKFTARATARYDMTTMSRIPWRTSWTSSERIILMFSSSSPTSSPINSRWWNICSCETHKKSSHENNIIRVLSQVIYFRLHWLSNDYIRTHICFIRFDIKFSNYELVRLRVMNWQFAFQSEIMFFYKHDVKKTCIVMKNKTYFKEIDRKHRLQLWKVIFQSNSIKMTCVNLTKLCEVVAIDDIYFDNFAKHLKWQRYLLITFVVTCENVFKYTYMQKKKERFFSDEKHSRSSSLASS